MRVGRRRRPAAGDLHQGLHQPQPLPSRLHLRAVDLHHRPQHLHRLRAAPAGGAAHRRALRRARVGRPDPRGERHQPPAPLADRVLPLAAAAPLPAAGRAALFRRPVLRGDRRTPRPAPRHGEDPDTPGPRPHVPHDKKRRVTPWRRY